MHAAELFQRAAEAEQKALDAIEQNKPRTIGITATSAVALSYKAGKLETAAQLAHRAFAIKTLPPFALRDLRELLQTIWNEQAQREARRSFVPGQVLASVKGGEVVSGGAPLDVILDKVQLIQSLFIELLSF